MQWPIRKHKVVSHLGSLEKEQKGTQFKESYEGSFLSVSVHPQAWRQIASLGGQPEWALRKEDREWMFLDAYELSETQKEELKQWGHEKGLLCTKELFEATQYDEEGKRLGVTWHQSYEEALEEAQEEEGDVRQVQKDTIAASAMFKEFGYKERDCIDGWDWLLVLWAKENADIVDGVWFEEKLNVLQYSAPRGALNPEVLDAATTVKERKQESQEHSGKKLRR